MTLMLGSALLAWLHMAPGTRSLNPLSEPLSDYALTSNGWIFDTAVLVQAAGVLALRRALLCSGHITRNSPATAVLGICAISMIGIVAFPEDPPGTAISVIAKIHWLAAMIAFGGLALFPALMNHPARAGCSRLPAVARGLSTPALIAFLLLLVGSVLNYTQDLPARLWLPGLVERILVALELATAVVLTAWLWRGCRCRQSER